MGRVWWPRPRLEANQSRIIRVIRILRFRGGI